MTMKRLSLALALASLLPAQSVDELRALIENRTGEAKKAVGIAAGVIDEKGRLVFASGRIGGGRNTPPDGDTIFEIGSITKVFTSLLLADMAEKGEVKLDDLVAKYLPESVKVPSMGDRQITLLDLSMQVSGLPRMPDNFKPANPMNPYADYGTERLFEFLNRHKLTRAPGEKYEYSNLAVGLLGTALARRAGTSYEALVRKRILDPLGMTSTTITLSEEQRRRLAPGHNSGLEPTANWDLDALAGAGALRSTVNDMLKFLAANMELIDSPLKPAIRRMRSQLRPTDSKDMSIAMGWHVLTKYGQVFWHNGGTGGYRTHAGFDPETKRGAVVLCNTSFGVDDIGRHFIDSKYSAAKLPAAVAVTEVKLDAATLDEYAGEYKLAPVFSIVVRRDGDKLMASATNQPEFQVYATKKDEFFYKVVEARLSFTRDAAGKVTGLVLHQNGRDLPGPKVK
jgi:CubicO group peptidase (beta-lactamase class C family)